MKKLVFLMVAVVTLSMFGCSNESSVEDNTTDNDVIIESNDPATDDSTNNEAASSENDMVSEEEDATDEVISDMNLEELITQTYEASGLELPMTAFSPLTKENQAYMVGTDAFDFLEGVVSEPMMSSVAHSFVLFTVEEGSDIEAIKEAVRTNVDVRKWICVSVEPEQVVVENFGNMIVLIMEERSDAFYTALESIINQ